MKNARVTRPPQSGYSRSRWCHIPPDTVKRIHEDIAVCFETGIFVNGDFSRRLEECLGAYWGQPAAALSSGTAGLELILEYLEIEGKKVLVPANCYQGIPVTVLRTGGIPVPVPIEPVTLAMDPEEAMRLCSQADAVIWVHHCGMVHPSARDTIRNLQEQGCFVIEDCAYMVPVEERRDAPGTLGDASLFSFYATKPLTAGRGGAIVSQNRQLIDYLRVHRIHGGEEAIWDSGGMLPRNRTIGELHAIIAYHQWQRLKDIRDRLLEVGREYASLIHSTRPELLPAGREVQPTIGKMTIQLPKKHEAPSIAKRLWASDRIHCSVMYERPWFEYPWFEKKLGEMKGDFGGLKEILAHNLCLPYHEKLTAEDQEFVVGRLVEVVGK